MGLVCAIQVALPHCCPAGGELRDGRHEPPTGRFRLALWGSHACARPTALGADVSWEESPMAIETHHRPEIALVERLPHRLFSAGTGFDARGDGTVGARDTGT